MDKNPQQTPKSIPNGDAPTGRPMDGAAEDQRFMRNLENNVDEIKAVDAAGVAIQEDIAKQAPISEDEAKRLLAEEKRLAEIEYGKAQGKSKKILVTVLIVAAVLCVFGAVFALVIGGMNGGEDEKDEVGQNEVVEP